MQTRIFGSTGAWVSTIGQGTWEIESDKAAAVIALKRGIELGLTHIDTAEMYGSGIAETVVAEAIRGVRQQIFLVSKVLPSNASAEDTKASCEASLRRLGTDYLDVYLLHWPGSHPLEQTIRAFESLKEEGKIRAWGVSNFDVPLLDEAESIAGPGKIACNQVLYHLKERAVEERVLPWCKRKGVALVGYSPFGSGDFPKADSSAGKVLQSVAAEHNATPRQVALKFLTRDPILFTIPKSSNHKHVEENAGAENFELTDQDIRRISGVFPLITKKSLPTI